MFPEPSFSTTALAIVSCTLLGSGIGALFGYLIGYECGNGDAAGIYSPAIHDLSTRINELNEMLAWKDFPEDQEETTFQQLMKARAQTAALGK
mgnify:FL=1